MHKIRTFLSSLTKLNNFKPFATTLRTFYKQLVLVPQ